METNQTNEVEEVEKTVENEVVEENTTTETVETEPEISKEEELTKKLDEAEAKAKDYLDKWQRLMAEFDNFRKRSAKEKADSYDFAVSNVIVELLPIIDNFERALNIDSTDKKLYTGVKMIHKQIMDMLDNLNVSPIETEGATFDPKLHSAIEHVEDEKLGENMIAEEVQKGYVYKEKVIRHSMVKVAN